MTNKTYDLKPGYYWKVIPTTDPYSSTVLSLMQTCTTWDEDYEIDRHYLKNHPTDPEAQLESGMSRIKGHHPTKFSDYSDYTEDITKYEKALKNVTSSIIR